MTIETEKKEDGILLKIQGRIDTVTSPQLQMEILNAFQKANRVVLDFEQVEYVSSAGLRALLIGEKTALAKNGKLLLTHVANVVQTVFDMTGFSKILTVEE